MSKTKNTTEVTLRSRNRFRFCSTTETIGADTSHTSTGKVNNVIKRTRASSVGRATVVGAGDSGVFKNNNGNSTPAVPRVMARVPGKDGPAPAR